MFRTAVFLIINVLGGMWEAFATSGELCSGRFRLRVANQCDYVMTVVHAAGDDLLGFSSIDMESSH